MVSTDFASRARSAESRGKFITRPPAPRTPRSTRTSTPELPIVPPWLGWR